MKKLINVLLIIQTVIFLTACCCPCGKKAPEQSQAPAQPQQGEQAPQN